MTLMDYRPPVSAVDMPEWLPAESAEDSPRDGQQINPGEIHDGDYLWVAADGDRPAFWSLITCVVEVEGQSRISYRHGGYHPLRPVPGMQLWVLRAADAASILRGRRGEIDRLAFQHAIEHMLRTVSAADLLEAHRLVRATEPTRFDTDGPVAL